VPLAARAAGPARRAPGRAAARPPGLLRRAEFVLVPEEPSAGREIPVRERVVTVGREAPARAIIDDGSVSRVHARLDVDGGRLTVTDLKSSNGTLVNGAPALRAELHPGDALQFGNVRFTVERRETWATDRIRLLAIGVGALAVLGVGVAGLNDWLVERQAIREARERVRREAVASVRRGIGYYEHGELDYAASSLLYAADALLFSGLAPPGATLAQPARVFQPVLAELPPDDRDFDFAKALDPRTAESALHLEDLSPHEYVRRQVKRVAIELGQDENVPDGFIEEVWGYVRESMSYPGRFQTILNRSARYQPMLRQRLAAARLPEMFCYVAWVESGLDPNILSPAGALGMWQFEAAAGRESGLRVDPAHGIDERTDPEKATDAAARYISKLLNRFGPEQFMLALASYNRGWTGVLRSVEGISDPMMPSSKRFWYLVESGRLPRETSEYVPRIFAMRIMGAEPARFGFRPPGRRA
jgi:hypothetical protein